MNYSQTFQILSLRKMNIANAEPTFDQNKCNIQIFQ